MALAAGQKSENNSVLTLLCSFTETDALTANYPVVCLNANYPMLTLTRHLMPLKVKKEMTAQYLLASLTTYSSYSQRKTE